MVLPEDLYLVSTSDTLRNVSLGLSKLLKNCIESCVWSYTLGSKNFPNYRGINEVLRIERSMLQPESTFLMSLEKSTYCT